MNPELLEWFENGLIAWLDSGDLNAARENFEYCINALNETGQCDLYRALAEVISEQTQDPAPPEQLEKIYTSRNTWGEVLQRLSNQNNRLIPATVFATRIALGFLDLDYTLRTPTAAHIGYSVLQLERGKYSEALEAIRSAPVRNPAVQIVEANIFLRTERWKDLEDLSETMLSPLMYDAYDRHSSEIDGHLQSAGYLLSGIALAHLGKFVEAKQRLEKSDVTRTDERGNKYHYPAIGAKACYYLGLMARAEGSEPDAQIYFSTGLGQERTPELLAAQVDTSITLRKTTAELINQRTSYWEVATEPDLDEVLAAERDESNSSILEEAMAELIGQEGMQSVKDQVSRLKASVAYAQDAKRRGIEVKNKSLHMVFTGPPGTGKTTIARIIAKIFVGLGVCKNDKVIEASRGTILGQHEGKSTAGLLKAIKKAEGGILFIDEAYELVQNRSGGIDPFGQEVMTQLVLEMENRRESLVVILAGYEGKMNELLATNDGLNSRFSRRVRFTGYNPEEIGNIAAILAADRNSILPPDSATLIVQAAAMLRAIPDKDGQTRLDIAGNGRFARNVVEAAEEYRDIRLSEVRLDSLSNEEFKTLAPEDIAHTLRDIVDPLLGRAVAVSIAEQAPNTAEGQN